MSTAPFDVIEAGSMNKIQRQRNLQVRRREHMLKISWMQIRTDKD